MTDGLLVIMGSGETAPTMVKPHRAIFEELTRRLGADRPAVVLDTPYGFQSNADDISAKAVGYFAASVGREVEVVTWRTPPPPGLARERALAALGEAGWIFAGPGSPTYALQQWRDTPIPGALTDVLGRGGVVLFASAAALTLGSHAIPVYEIYKAGFDPAWVPGLGIVEAVTGLPAVVIPHYDNAEGGHHDTRFCYLGEGRLSTMEQELPAGSFILGVDEHTGVLLDLAARTATVVGNGVLTLRRAGRSTTHPAGTVLDFDALADLGGTTPTGHAAPSDRAAPADRAAAADRATPAGQAARTGHSATNSGSDTGTADQRPATSLRGAAEALGARFDAALRARDVDGCVAAALDLEQALLDWAADTLTSDEGDYARGLLRQMLLRLGELAEVGIRDPRDGVSGFVTTLLELRRRARLAGDFATSDWIRDQLSAAEVQVRDTPEGTEWELA